MPVPLAAALGLAAIVFVVCVLFAFDDERERIRGFYPPGVPRPEPSIRHGLRRGLAYAGVVLSSYLAAYVVATFVL